MTSRVVNDPLLAGAARRWAHLEWPPMSQWVRLLNRVTSASAEWHVPRTKSFTTTTYCGKELAGSLEVGSDGKAEREGRCSPCMTRLASTEGVVPHASWPIAPTSPEGAAAKKAAAKKTVTTTAPKGRSGKAPLAKRPVRRSRRGRA